jgi:hypothetical protein
LGVKVGIFSSGCREEKTSQTLTPKSRLQNNFETPGRKSRRPNRTFPTTLASRGLVSATRLKVSAHDERAFVTKMSRAREHRLWLRFLRSRSSLRSRKKIRRRPRSRKRLGGLRNACMSHTSRELPGPGRRHRCGLGLSAAVRQAARRPRSRNVSSKHTHHQTWVRGRINKLILVLHLVNSTLMLSK